MYRTGRVNSLAKLNETTAFRSDVIAGLRQALLAPAASYRPSIQQALQRANFRFHRTCSYANIIQECDVGEGKTLLMFWGTERSESRVTMSVSSCSSLHNLPLSTGTAGGPAAAAAATSSFRERELRHISQQTDISCRHPSVAMPVVVAPPTTPIDTTPVSQVAMSECAVGELPSPANSVLAARGRSISLLGSVCALLLSKPGSVVKTAPSYTGSRSPTDNICRICFGGESAERLVRPCSCRGTIAAVHRTCLERWLLQASTSYCELCRHHYIVTRSHNYGDGRWSWLSSLAAWAWSGRGRALLCDVWRALALGAASVLGTARALHACDVVLQAGARRGGGSALAANLFSSLLIGVIGALNGLLTTWMLLKIQEHQVSWQTWRDSTLHVHVTLAGEGDSERGSDVTVVGGGGGGVTSPVAVSVTLTTADRATNIADPFMVALPYSLQPEP